MTIFCSTGRAKDTFYGAVSTNGEKDDENTCLVQEYIITPLSSEKILIIKNLFLLHFGFI
jgi:hypothetical protein